MKHLGQHFLTSQKIAERIAQEANIGPEDVILEIGPGKGMLTDALLTYHPKKIIAVEKDKRLSQILKEKYASSPNIVFIEGDIRFLLRETLFQKLLGTSYKVVSNIPYYLTSYLFRLLLTEGDARTHADETRTYAEKDKTHLPTRIVLMVQKEVAKRIIARPPRMNLLALSIQSMGKPRIAFSVPRSFFKPRPKVDSAVIVIENISDEFFKELRPALGNKISKGTKKNFFNLLHAGFRHKRKKLANNISSFAKKDRKELEHIFKTCKISQNARAENLSLDEWKCLFENAKRKAKSEKE